MAKQNLYTAIKEAANAPPHKDTGDNNLYVKLGMRKTTKERYEEAKAKYESFEDQSTEEANKWYRKMSNLRKQVGE